MSRNNLDYQHTNNNGNLLLNLCKETRIRILNERTTGDLNGQATCISFKNCNSQKLDPLPGKFLLTDDAITLYTENIQSQIFENKIIDFITTDFRDSNLIIDSFNSVLQDCAKQSAKFISKVPTQKIRKSNRKLWFTQSGTDLRHTVKSYEKLVNKNGQYRKLFYTYG